MEVKFTVPCQAVYVATMEIEEDFMDKLKGQDIKNVFDIDDEIRFQILDYINENLNEVPATDLEWIADFEVEDVDIIYVDNISGRQHYGI